MNERRVTLCTCEMGHEEVCINSTARRIPSFLGWICEDRGVLFWLRRWDGGVNHPFSFLKLMCYVTITASLIWVSVGSGF